MVFEIFFKTFIFMASILFLVEIFRDDKYKIIRDRGEQLSNFSHGPH